MFDLDIMRLVAAKGGHPLSVASLISAIFLPSSLLVYFTRPDLFARFGIAGGLLFGAAVGFPVVFACCWPWHVFLWAAEQTEGHEKRLQDVTHNVAAPSEPALAEQLAAEDPFEWPMLLMGGWTANGVLYILVVIAYYRPTRLGATLILTVSIALGVWLVLTILFGWLINKKERDTDAMIESILKARSQPQPR